MAAVRITVEFEGAEHTLAFARSSEAVSVERALCIACGVPWGSVTRLVDATGAVYAVDPALFPDGKKLMLEVVAVPREPPQAARLACLGRREAITRPRYCGASLMCWRCLTLGSLRGMHRAARATSPNASAAPRGTRGECAE